MRRKKVVGVHVRLEGWRMKVRLLICVMTGSLRYCAKSTSWLRSTWWSTIFRDYLSDCAKRVSSWLGGGSLQLLVAMKYGQVLDMLNHFIFSIELFISSSPAKIQAQIRLLTLFSSRSSTMSQTIKELSQKVKQVFKPNTSHKERPVPKELRTPVHKDYQEAKKKYGGGWAMPGHLSRWIILLKK